MPDFFGSRFDSKALKITASMALILFFIVRSFNKIREREKKEEEAVEEAALTKEEELLTEIRDLLKRA